MKAHEMARGIRRTAAWLRRVFTEVRGTEILGSQRVGQSFDFLDGDRSVSIQVVC